VAQYSLGEKDCTHFFGEENAKGAIVLHLRYREAVRGRPGLREVLRTRSYLFRSFKGKGLPKENVSILYILAAGSYGGNFFLFVEGDRGTIPWQAEKEERGYEGGDCRTCSLGEPTSERKFRLR